MSTHNLCFRAKIRKNVYPCTLQFYFTTGCKGVFVTRTCFRDELTCNGTENQNLSLTRNVDFFFIYCVHVHQIHIDIFHERGTCVDKAENGSCPDCTYFLSAF